MWDIAGSKAVDSVYLRICGNRYQQIGFEIAKALICENPTKFQ